MSDLRLRLLAYVAPVFLGVGVTLGMVAWCGTRANAAFGVTGLAVLTDPSPQAVSAKGAHPISQGEEQ
jgi:hypothetical protein